MAPQPQKAKRRYQEVWEVLKTSKQKTVICGMSIAPNATDMQLQRAFKTFRRAVQKEKNQDEAFKYHNPGAVLNATLQGTEVTFTLFIPPKATDFGGI